VIYNLEEFQAREEAREEEANITPIAKAEKALAKA
jgi:hypothetical protein